MLRALSSEQSRAIEARAVAETGAKIESLMRSAGAAVAEELALRVPSGDVLVLVGPGNNGADGWIAARDLAAAGRKVRVLSVRDPAAAGTLAGDAAREAIAAGVPWRVASEAPSADELAGASAIVDGLLGIGAALPLREPLPAWCEAVNASGTYVLSIDVPTGVDSDSGAASSVAIQADCTVTFTAPKLGVVLYPGAGCAGEIVVAEIGIDPQIADIADAPEVWVPEEYAALLPLPAIDAHKNERGRVLVVGGSGTFPGAAILAARGAMRAGAGYVTLAVPEPIVAVAQAHLLAVPVVGLPAGGGKTFSSAAAAVALDLAQDYDAVVLGPGMTLADGAAATARSLVASLRKPLVIDADGLNALVDALEIVEARTAPTVLTPHPGELARLLRSSAELVQRDRVVASARLAGPARAVVLKGAGTIVSIDDRQVINTSGSPALATAGSGDVLSGVIGAFLAQGLDPLHAGALGAYVHGRAGEAAAAELTPLAVTAEDLPGYLSSAFAELLQSW